MPALTPVRPPVVYRWLVILASWLAPQRARAEWRTRWDARLRDWWVLVERGELPDDGRVLLGRHCWGAFSDAFWIRCSREHLRWWLRGPVFPLVAGLALVASTAIWSGGFRGTRRLIAGARAVFFNAPVPPSLGRPQDVVVAYILVIVFALAVGVALVGVGRLSVHGYGWRYWLLFGTKTGLVLLMTPVLWIELRAAAVALLPSGEIFMVLLSGLLLTVAFVGAFGCALLWSFADQRGRCPDCLHLLAMPVRVGSWASMFEPPATEFLCEEGHGSLCIPESESGEPERWTTLDSSWRDLFDPKLHLG